MTQKNKAPHAVKAATKIAIYDCKMAEDKMDIRAAIEAYQQVMAGRIVSEFASLASRYGQR